MTRPAKLPWAVLLFFFFSAGHPAFAIDSQQSGPWSDPATWAGGAVPTSADPAAILAGHTVTVDAADAAASTLTISGTLSFSRVAFSSLTVAGGDITVQAGGHLDLGTEADPLGNGATAHMVLAYGQTAGQYGLIVNNGGDFTVRGATKSPYGFATESINAGATTLKVALTSTTRWGAGDVITIGPTDANVNGQGPASVWVATITAVSGEDPNVITFAPAVDTARVLTATSPILVANLTRNVLVRSSGTDTGANTAYIQNLTQNATRFSLSYGEFAYLGTGLSGRQGITFDGSLARGSVSSSTVRHGYYGIRLAQAGGNTLERNLVFSNADQGIYIDRGRGNNINANLLHANGGAGGRITGTGANYNIIDGNYFYSNGQGFTTSGSANFNVISRNAAFFNDNQGISTTNTGGMTILGNKIYANDGEGLEIASNNLVVSNDIYDNTGIGCDPSALRMDGANRNVLVSNNIFGNSGCGVEMRSAVDNLFVDLRLGYDGSGVSRPNGHEEINFSNDRGEQVVAKNLRVTPGGALDTGDLDQPGEYLLSYSQDFGTGTLRLWGDYTLSGSTWTLDHALRLYASTATVPKLLRGMGGSHGASVCSTDDTSAVSQLVTLEYNGANWTVTGSSTGAMGTIAAGSCQSIGGGQAQVHITEATPQTGDRLDFILVAASGDAGARKRLLFGPTDPILNSGKSKLTVAPDAGIVFRGVAGEHALIDRLSDSSTYYSFVSSGAFTAHFSSFTNMDFNGIQLSGNKGVAISSSTFDFLGLAGTANAYITARDLTSNATFYSVTFNTSRDSVGVSSTNVRVEGTDAGLVWFFRGRSGPLWGEDFDDDPNGRVTWSDQPPASPAAGAVYASSVAISWGLVGADGYVAEASTAPDFTGTLHASPAGGPTDSVLTVSGLDPNTTYYLRAGALWAASTSYAVAPATSTLAVLVSGAQAMVFVSSATANWAPLPAGPSDQTAEGYLLEVSTRAGFSPLWTSSRTAGVSLSTLSVAGLDVDATFYFRVGSLNWNDAPHFVFIASVSVSYPPADIVDLATRAAATVDRASLTWTAPGDNLLDGTAASYEIRYSTDPITGANFGLADLWAAARPVGGPSGTAEQETVTGLAEGTTYYFAVRTRDPAGNVSGISNVVFYVPGVDVSPTVLGFSPGRDRQDVRVSTTVRVAFSKTMLLSSLNAAFSVRAVKDRSGADLNQGVAGTLAFSTQTRTLVFTPAGDLSKNHVYEVRLTTDATDLSGVPIPSSATWRFRTIFDHAVSNVVASPAGPEFSIPAEAFAADGYLRVSTGVGNSALDAATSKLLGQSRFRSPVDTLEVHAFDLADAAVQPAAALSIRVPYPDADQDGFIDGMSPPVREGTLALWHLEETVQLWRRVPGSRVDAAANALLSPLPHFSYFAAIGGEDLSLDDAFAYPVPYVPSRQATRVITFQNLSSRATLRIYTVSGTLVRTIEETDGDGVAVWDVRNAGGQEVASGVYLYVIFNESHEKKGKLIVVR